jgi:hypothetical protein
MPGWRGGSGPGELSALGRIVGDAHVLAAGDDLGAMRRPTRDLSAPAAVVKPRTTEEVSAPRLLRRPRIQ